jgi:hypothetical protein
MARTDRTDALFSGEGGFLPMLDEKLPGSACLSIFLSRMRSESNIEALSWWFLWGVLLLQLMAGIANCYFLTYSFENARPEGRCFEEGTCGREVRKGVLAIRRNRLVAIWW